MIAIKVNKNIKKENFWGMNGSLQIKNNKYYAVFRVNHKQKWISLKIPATKGNKRRANDALKKILNEYTDNAENINDMFLIDYLEMWLKQIKPLIKASTYEGYVKVVNGKVKPYFADKRYKLRELRGMHFTEFFIYLKEHGKSNGRGGLGKKTILNIRGVLSSAFVYAMENNLISDNVIEHSRIPLFEEKKFEPIIYTPEQIKNLLEYAESTNSDVCLFLFLEMFTGARKGELLGLTWDNVDFDNNTIRIVQNRTGSKKEVLSVLTTPKTKNGIRTLALPHKVMDMLKAEKQQQRQNKELLKSGYKTYDHDFVIRKADGSVYNPNSINRIIKRLTEQLGLPHCRIHDYRHAVASILFEKGTTLSDVTMQLGHGQTSTTERIYIHRSGAANIENAKTLSNALGM